MDDLIISVFCEIDNFCKGFIPYMKHQCIQNDDSLLSLELPSRLVLSEAMTICAVFPLSRYRTFKWFYEKLILKDYRKFFPNSVNDFLKNICQIEHSRHRSCCNFVVNLVSGIVAYSFLPKKPSIYTTLE